MGVGKEILPVLIVALLTWGGVFVYILRLDALARMLEKEVSHRNAEAQKEEHEVSL